MSPLEELLYESCKKIKVELDENQIKQFMDYKDMLLEWNEKMNLTAITDERDIMLKHFADCLVICSGRDFSGKRMIDVGTGAGFPGVPLKILRPDIKLTLLDSLQKRINFLNQLLKLLGINDVKTIHSRAEDYIKQGREKFEYALSRAVASVPTLAEYLLPYVKVDGEILMYKGSGFQEELDLGHKAIKILGGQVENVLNYKLNEIDSQRNIIIIKKISMTDKKYPRGKNLPKLKPLQ